MVALLFSFCVGGTGISICAYHSGDQLIVSIVVCRDTASSDVGYKALCCCKVLRGVLSGVATVCGYSTADIAENCAKVVEFSLCAAGRSE